MSVIDWLTGRLTLLLKVCSRFLESEHVEEYQQSLIGALFAFPGLQGGTIGGLDLWLFVVRACTEYSNATWIF
jgi:hypothetical protein